MELPKPRTPELVTLIPDEEARIVYEYLYQRRNDPPTMVEVRDHITAHYGEAHSQTDRRLRDLRDKYLIAVRTDYVKGRGHVYRLLGMLPDAANREGRLSINKRERAEVLTRYHSRCAMCGKNPTEDGVKLVIDHIVPLDWGGQPKDPENLQPLCEDCNLGKKAHYSSFNQYADAIRHAMSLGDAHTRIGELLRAMQGEAVPSELIGVVAREENAGDFKKRLRELRYILGWDIKATKKKVGKRTHSYYTCNSWQPYPPEGAKATVAKYEAARRKRKAAS